MNRSRLAALSAGAMFLVASVLVPATALAAGSGTLTLSGAPASVAQGSTFTVTINTQATVPMSGASAAIDFDKARLQIVSVVPGADWSTAAMTVSSASVASIGTANATGHLAAISSYFTCPSTGSCTGSLPANTNAVLATVTFFAISTGSANISLPTQADHPSGGSDFGAILDGTTGANYGSPVGTTATPSTTTPATVTITAGSGSNKDVTATITGSVDNGYLSMSCDSPVVVPLVRNVNNISDFFCKVSSNVTWTMSTKDNNPDPATHGHMVDSAQGVALHDRLVIHSSQYDQSLAGSPDLLPIFGGQNNINVPLEFQQYVAPNDKPGSYGMSVLFSITSNF
ncbi:MAG TPA: cohesin domain-containing protein [Mycobacterium sp.]|nr:cohesin domain-containing protein [Mycobacterium sp.]